MKRTDVIREIAYVLALLELDEKPRGPKHAVWLVAKRLGVDLEVTPTMINRKKQAMQIGRATRDGQTHQKENSNES